MYADNSGLVGTLCLVVNGWLHIVNSLPCIVPMQKQHRCTCCSLQTCIVPHNMVTIVFFLRHMFVHIRHIHLALPVAGRELRC